MNENNSTIELNGIFLNKQSIAEIIALQVENGSYINYSNEKISELIGMLACYGDATHEKSPETILEYIHFLSDLSRILKQFKQ